MSNNVIGGAAAGLLALAAAAAGHAAIVVGTTGTVYLNQPGNTVNPALSGPGDATFTPGPIDYNPSDNGGVYTIGAFLNNPVFSNESPAFATNGGNTSFSYGTGNTQIDITGTIMLNAGNNSFVVGHDDGVILTIPGLGYSLNAGGPTAYTTTPFNVVNAGPAGNYTFTLDYVECCGPPAALVFSNNGTPEPATWTMMIVGLAGLGGVLRRTKSRAALAF